jgi:hypothetical protein
VGTTTIEVDWDRRLLVANHSGAWTVDGSVALVDETLRLSAETGIDRVLFDHRNVQLDRTTTQIFRHSEDLQLLAGLERLKMALVHPAGDLRLRADYRFFGDAMSNRGMAVRVFDGDVEAAAEWLTG